MFYFYKLKLEAPDLNGVVTLSLPTYNPNIITQKGPDKIQLLTYSGPKG